jgi:galactokinase
VIGRLVSELGASPSEIRVVRAPGRVNQIGEHTDYNDGFVLPAAISLETTIAFVPSHDRRVELASAEGASTSFSLDAFGPERGWADYVKGVAWSLMEAGITVHGFRGVLGSTVPVGAGLSSSAALELAVAWALCGGSPPVDGMELAQLAQRAENEYVGVQSGLMDQFASSLGVAGCAMLLDCRSLQWRSVALPADVQLVAIDSKSPRRLAASEYNARRMECGIAARRLGIASLRDATLEKVGRLDGVERMRAEHVVRENARVLETVAALESGDLATVGRCMAESHASLRDLYEVSSPALDALVEIASAVEGVVGARMTGAGFGGCTVNLVRRGSVEALVEAVEHEYAVRTGLAATVYPVEAVHGAGLVA